MDNTIFLSYRRSEAQLPCDIIFQFLEVAFGRPAVFRDLDKIPGGSDFPTVLNNALTHCKVAIVIIGPTWTTVRDSYGQRRLNNPRDFVRTEVETLLKRDIPVIPVLVLGAKMPTIAELPPYMQPLLKKNARMVREGQDFTTDMQRVTRDIAAFVQVQPTAPSFGGRLRGFWRRGVALVSGTLTLVIAVVAISTWLNIDLATILHQLIGR